MNRIALGLLLLPFLGRSIHPAPQEKAGIWLDVPFVKQSEDGCGSAAISMVLQYWNAHGARLDPQRSNTAAIQKQLYSRKARGIYASSIESYLRSSGFRVFPLQGEWKDLQAQLTQGRPLIVSLQSGTANPPFPYSLAPAINLQ